MTKRWDDVPTELITCAYAPRNPSDMILTALRDGPVPPRTIRTLLEVCGVSREEADVALAELGRQGKIKIGLEYNLALA